MKPAPVGLPVSLLVGDPTAISPTGYNVPLPQTRRRMIPCKAWKTGALSESYDSRFPSKAYFWRLDENVGMDSCISGTGRGLE